MDVYFSYKILSKQQTKHTLSFYFFRLAIQVPSHFLVICILVFSLVLIFIALLAVGGGGKPASVTQ